MAKPEKLSTIWASAGVSIDPDILTPGKFETGWEAEIPPYQHFNYYMNKHSLMLDHVNTYGICVWDALTTYQVGSKVIYNEEEYTCTTANSLGSVPSTLAQWTARIAMLEGKVGQSLNTTNTPTFADVTITGLTGTVESRIEANTTNISTNTSDISTLEGKVGQSLNTTNDVTFNNITINGSIFPTTSPTETVGTAATAYEASLTLCPKGYLAIYATWVTGNGALEILRYINGSWVSVIAADSVSSSIYWEGFSTGDDTKISGGNNLISYVYRQY